MLTYTVKLSCGLGNHLFQIASVWAIAEEHGARFVLERKKIPPPGHTTKVYTDLYAPFVTDEEVAWVETYHEPAHCEATRMRIPPRDRNCVFVGYFQSALYLDVPMVKWWLPTPDRNGDVYLHIRLGDYTQDPLHAADLRRYYTDCLAQVPSGTRVRIVTNDKEEAARAYPDLWDLLPLAEFEDEDDPLGIIQRMAGGRGVICANSTFSWWAAYLGHATREDFMAFVPGTWFMDGGVTYAGDFGFPGSRVVAI